jgi:hypothetical protein
MANYTSILLYISSLEEEKDRIAEVNTFLNNGNFFSLLDVNGISSKFRSMGISRVCSVIGSRRE